METINFVLSGLGGQGILFMTKVLAQAALKKGCRVMGAETHGMAQRGGSVVSHLRLGDSKGSLVRTGTAHFLLSLDESEAYRNLPFLAPGGALYANAGPRSFPRGEVRAYLEKKGIRWRAMEATRAAVDLGAPLSSNLALLGFFAGSGEGPMGPRDLEETIEMISPERFRNQNLRVFRAGLESAGGV
ncbi:MAG: indolepyruvate oxidoreductase subunit beta [Deltaproteobacteria bacterium]|nr:indolepyruvate oxidoreductase subunit beta [Deltaproteobacteria bacterium]MBW1949954.1 indolepyruvate oxidoreductase subunit beta [Deltaproteobacteria bacterium]MBW2101752.1 indolepyruvate oxidoreductase subunit beta [Deltaproteobacteria bacterium]